MSSKKNKSNVTLFYTSKHNLKRIASILLIFVLAFPAIKSFVIFTDFQLNRASITNELCENIESDENCKGTCHLVKEIKKENPEKKNSPFTARDNTKMEVLYFDNPSVNKLKLSFEINEYFLSQNLDFDTHIRSVFHPPRLIYIG